MGRWEGPIDFEKYYGHKKYMDIQEHLEKIDYTKKEKDKMSYDIVKYIIDNNYTLYHDLMNDICDSHPDWFNMLTFDRKNRQFILIYMKSKARSKHTKHQ